MLRPRPTPLFTREILLGLFEIEPLKKLFSALKIGSKGSEHKALAKTTGTAQKEVFRVLDQTFDIGCLIHVKEASFTKITKVL